MKSRAGEKQKEVLANFYANFALAVLTLGLINPIFSGIVNIKDFIIKLVISVLVSIFLLLLAFKTLK
jgi:hypothetical protein